MISSGTVTGQSWGLFVAPPEQSQKMLHVTAAQSSPPDNKTKEQTLLSHFQP